MINLQKTLAALGVLTISLGLSNPVLAQSQDSQSTDKSSAEAAPQKNPAYTYIQTGDRAFADGKYKESIDAYTQALQIFNQNAYAYYNRGNAYRKLKDYPAAIDDYTMAIQLNPQDPFVYLYRGLSYQAANEPEKAIADYTQLIKLDEQNAAAYHRRAQSYASLKQFDLARTDFSKSADLYRRQRESGLAEKVLSEMRALKASPGDKNSKDSKDQ